MMLAEATAELLALLRRHLAPSMPVLEQMTALLGRQPLEAPVALDHALPLAGRQAPETLPRLAQPLALLGPQRSPSTKALQHLLLFLGRQALELLIVLLRRVTFLRRHL